MNKTYPGSCHCKRITFEADVAWSVGTGKCNCTSCWKKRWWSVKVPVAGFRSLTGETELSGYKEGQPGHAGFCKHCGVIPYGFVAKSEWNPAEYYSVNVAALDNLDPADLMSAPVTYYDGLHNNWMSKPVETRHL